jgi:hypothetical protein
LVLCENLTLCLTKDFLGIHTNLHGYAVISEGAQVRD